MSALLEVLQNHSGFASVTQSAKPFKRLDFSEGNAELLRHDLTETSAFSAFIFDKMLEKNTFMGIGGYNENRVIYRQRKHFAQDHENPRSIHLGTDIWANAGEPIYAPLDATIHSFAFNDHYGDYGPTIILRHELHNVTFFTLYGHLSLYSLDDLHVGKTISANTQFATIGPYPENGDWPPHLHFQLISDIGHHNGDFPGVSSIQDRAHYLNICPDPNLILRVAENS
ncbi:peptidoglycan DD-metalloendopeptidase family protein [Dyadobacter sp. CY326]|uniref:peptidoglycan DD-metalloendopeptidase family protein n=1 Tax=Dyadobacter sp. CY326 TaxID=2907300 RepID=UPI001F284EE1|nr:peptidoglycan DD-metalloendopeptidase family protein [Dyadobacter sp. CY326]MCE7068313.1 peptidoglycan DD-metalloendopeptidase family protein [Dyadobacter sp. CY326]